MWWPAHRPLQTWEITGVSGGSPSFQMLDWSRGIPGTNAGDQKMATSWYRLGFVIKNPAASEEPSTNPPDQKYISVERNDTEGIV